MARKKRQSEQMHAVFVLRSGYEVVEPEVFTLSFSTREAAVELVGVPELVVEQTR